jgi:hypothetical protein
MTPSPVQQIRIDGVITLTSELISLDVLKKRFANWLDEAQFSGKIEPLNPDSESYMVSVERHVLEGKNAQIENYEKAVKAFQMEELLNDQAYKDLAEKLSKAEEERDNYVRAYSLAQAQLKSYRNENMELSRENIALEKRLELKESTRWKTFIKWVIKLKAKTAKLIGFKEKAVKSA